MSEPTVVVVPDAETAAMEAAERIADILADAVAARDRADWATTGGSTPGGIYRRLSEPPLRDRIPWPAVHVWWGDDRAVPRDHPWSNVKPLDDILLGVAPGDGGTGTGGTGVALPVENLHPFRTTEAIGSTDAPAGAQAADDGPAAGAAEAAIDLELDLRDADLPTADGWPILDLFLLGVGGDGHLLSVFPGSAALESDAWALAIPAPTHIEPRVARVTLNPALLGVARQLIVVVTGGAKADVVASIFGSERDPQRWPAQLARRAGAVWILDEAAATRAATQAPPGQFGGG